jgi:DNA-binding transcriptional MerR regulator
MSSDYRVGSSAASPTGNPLTLHRGAGRNVAPVNGASPPTLTIQAFARSCGVAVSTIRYYERAGVLRAASRTPSGYRRFGVQERARFQSLRLARELGFSLREAKSLLSLDAGESSSRREVRDRLERHIQDTEERIAKLRALQARLRSALGRCRATRDSCRCPILADLRERPLVAEL